MIHREIPGRGRQPGYHADGHREPAGSPADEPYDDLI